MASNCGVKLYSVTQEIAFDNAKLIINLVNRLEQRYSRYLKHNLLYKINKTAKAGGSISIDEETAALLNYAESCFNNSNGLFDISSGILRKAWDFKSNKLPEKDLVNRLLDKVGWDKVIWKAPTYHLIAKTWN